MNTEILVNVSLSEARVAVLDNGILQEVLIERVARQSLLGNLFKGRVVRVLPGIQAAFVDIGLERTAFLHVSDLSPRQIDSEPDIRSLLREGDELLVQVIKEPIGTKGARLSTAIAMPSRFLVLLPGRPGVSISVRIDDEDERERLRAMATQVLGADDCGVILRTAAEGAPAEAVHADLQFVKKIWESVARKAAQVSGVQCLHADLPLAVRALRDMATRDIDRIRVDSPATLADMRDFLQEFVPALLPKVELYEGRRPIFDLHGVDDEIDHALGQTVSLKSGGYLVIDQTEAMTTIDVNTGAYVGHSNQDETIFRTNLEAAAAVARQLRLRNLGGIIIIDFIDMASEGHREQVMDALRTALSADQARTQISHVSPLGLVEMTRKRTRESLEHILCRPCPACDGRGRIKTAETVCYEIFREILRQHRLFPHGDLTVLAHNDVIEMLLDEEARSLGELEQLTGCTLRLQAQTMSTPDEFDVVPM